MIILGYPDTQNNLNKEAGMRKKRAVKTVDFNRAYAKARAAEKRGDTNAINAFHREYKNTTRYSGIHSANDKAQCPTGWRDPYDPDCDWSCCCDRKILARRIKEKNKKELAVLEGIE